MRWNPDTGEIGTYYERPGEPFPYCIRLRYGNGVEKYETIEKLNEHWKEITYGKANSK